MLSPPQRLRLLSFRAKDHLCSCSPSPAIAQVGVPFLSLSRPCPAPFAKVRHTSRGQSREYWVVPFHYLTNSFSILRSGASMFTVAAVPPVTDARAGALHFDGSPINCSTLDFSAAGSDSSRFAAPSGVLSASVSVATVFWPILFSKMFSALLVVA